MSDRNEHQAAESIDEGLEADVRRAIRRRFETLDPIAARVAARPASTPIVAARRAASQERNSGHHSRRIGFGLAGVAVLVAVVLAPLALRQATNPAATGTPAATESPWPADWTVPVIPASAGRVISVDGNARGWLAVLDADGVRQVWYSRYGATWARLPNAESVFRLAGVTQVVATPSGFLVVEDRGDIGTRFWWSTDAETWQAIQSPTHLVVRVLWGRGGFVVLGGSDAWQSSDLANWSQPKALGSSVVLTGNAGTSRGYIVSVDGGGTSASSLGWSPDGQNWTQRALTADDVLIGSAVGRDGMIAVGYSRSDQTRLVWRSVDGSTWTRSVATMPVAFTGLTSDGTDIFGVSGRTFFRSTNGTDWLEIANTAMVLPALAGPAAAYSGNLAVMGPSGEGLWMLPHTVLDKTEPLAAPKPGATPTSSASNGSPQETPSSNATPLPLPSANGTPPSGAWRSLTADATIPDSSSFQTVAGPKGIVSVTRQSAGSPGFTLYYSHDGKSFAKAETTDPSFERASIRLYATPSGFVGTGLRNIRPDGSGDPIIWYSADGSKWQPATVAGGLSWAPRAVAASPAGLLAVGSSTGPVEAFAFTSPDGVTWQRLALDPLTFRDADLTSVAWTASTGWVIAGGGPMIGPTIFQSADGTTWQSTRLKFKEGTGGGGLTLYAGRDGVVAESFASLVGTTTAAGPTAWSSRDGRTWSEPVAYSTPVAFGSNGTLIVRSNGAQIQESYDGATWYTLAASVTNDFWLDSVGPDGIFVLVHPLESTLYLKAAG